MYAQPYVCFNGRCEEALRFYEHAIGAMVSSCSASTRHLVRWWCRKVGATR